ncbi:leucine-rich repeat domain-containing protein [Ruminococcus albus]|uniref:Leucine rich repeat-containing protein n=1 Tax=Ruminococcus albus TaxID=1264 RepID=A0A1I1P4N7_RUMAL|nr:leucine-rich repeat domain-containing protein [Ruminococcus albus]SFD04924.1 Leucine rich repeat-containing protein [Ruminococcus albus]
MEDTKPKKSLPKRICIITLILLGLIFLIYVIINFVFWKKGMPERYFEYTILENDTVEIKHYTGSFFLLNIPDTIEGKPVTSIGYHIMWDKDSNALNWFSLFITSVHLPDTVEETHDYAFSNFTNLRTINIPSNLKRTGILILQDTKVTKLVFPEGITEIGDQAFNRCKALKKIVIPASVKHIDDHAFSECTSLEEVIIEGSPDMGEEVFAGCEKLVNKPE